MEMEPKESGESGELVLFTTVYPVDDYHEKPLPCDLFNSDGAVRAKKGQSVSREKLINSFVRRKIAEGPPFQTETRREASPTSPAETAAQSETYQEEKAHVIEARLDELHFVPFPVIKSGLKKNIHQFKEIFQKNYVENEVRLLSKNNRAISENVVDFLTKILENTSYAADYIEMVNAIRTPDNYVTFGHPSAMVFYALSIARKLKMLNDDFLQRKNVGRWIPIKTKKNHKASGALPFSEHLLKYIDQEKETVNLKFRGREKDEILETLTDLMYEYATIDWNESYPTMRINYESENMMYIGMAALNADLGKLAIPNKILNKPSSLDDSEMELMKSHTILGVQLLKEIHFNIPRVYAYIIAHHRLSEETGYPFFKNTPFPESKIIAIADIYDAMRSKKFYGAVKSQDAAFAILEDLYKKGCFDLPLYVAARHTFHEFNHDLVGKRNRESVEN